MDELDFDNLTSEVMQSLLQEELKELMKVDPKSALMFLIGKAVGKLEVLTQMNAIAKDAHREMRELMDSLNEGKQ